MVCELLVRRGIPTQTTYTDKNLSESLAGASLLVTDVQGELGPAEPVRRRWNSKKKFPILNQAPLLQGWDSRPLAKT